MGSTGNARSAASRRPARHVAREIVDVQQHVRRQPHERQAEKHAGAASANSIRRWREIVRTGAQDSGVVARARAAEPYE